MAESKHFIHEIIDEELKEGGRCYGQKVHTRFPPEPNGYLHIGHAKALEIDFGTAELYGGMCNLRMDDTNPTKEDEEFVDAIKEDIHWLGHDWEDRFYYASDYFDKMYEFAVELIKKGLAYVCELTPEQMKEMRGDTSTPAQSPYRDRPVEESLELFEKMKNGEIDGYLQNEPPPSPQNRQQMVHLPYVRLRSSYRRRTRGHHSFAVLSRVREPPSSLRLGR